MFKYFIWYGLSVWLDYLVDINRRQMDNWYQAYIEVFNYSHHQIVYRLGWATTMNRWISHTRFMFKYFIRFIVAILPDHSNQKRPVDGYFLLKSCWSTSSDLKWIFNSTICPINRRQMNDTYQSYIQILIWFVC